MTSAKPTETPPPAELWVVMPVYNEEEALPLVVEEWLPVLRQTVGRFRFLILNDGSKDKTLPILRELAARHPEIDIVDKPNSGHGQTCLVGYRKALEARIPWVLQIDSDGQCDAAFFPALWAAREKAQVVYGYRRKRLDGMVRFCMSRVVSLVTFAAARVWVRDANVPYRLMRTETLRDIVDDVPADFKLANILVAALHQSRVGIHWVDITFRQRVGGEPGVKTYKFVKEGWRLRNQLIQASRRAPRP